MTGKVFVCFLLGLVSVSAEERTEALQRQCQSPSLDSNISQEWVEKNSPKEGWYFPLISRSESDPAEDLIHRQVPKRNSKDEFCPRMTWINGEGEFVFFGKTWAIFQCSTNGTYASQACTVIDPDSEDGKVEKVNVFLTLTDSQSYLFALRCWDDGEQDWALATVEKNISAATKEVVLNHAESLGFDRKAYSEISYEKC